MSKNFNEWCEDYAAERMEEEYGPNWIDTCGDDDAYYGYLEEAGYYYPGDDDECDDDEDL